MTLDDPLTEGQATARALAIIRRLEPLEYLEDTVLLGRLDPVVANRYFSHRTVPFGGDTYP